MPRSLRSLVVGGREAENPHRGDPPPGRQGPRSDLALHDAVVRRISVEALGPLSCSYAFISECAILDMSAVRMVRNFIV